MRQYGQRRQQAQARAAPRPGRARPHEHAAAQQPREQRHRERAELDALRDEVAILRKRCGDCTHGDVEKDVAERETVIRELEAMLRGPQGKGAVRPVAALTIEKLRGEIEDIRSRVPALAAR